MRFKEIQFEKVGPFTDTTLAFNNQANLHLIHGPNEAGKSSALKQMLAFLFGFEAQSGDDFNHKYALHRVRSSFVNTNNQPMGPVERRRGNNNTLAGAQETDLHPAHIGRSEFDRLFAIDQERLRRGSQDLFKGTSDLKTILFESMTGMASISSIRNALQQKKDALLRARSGRIHDLVGKVGAAKKKENDILSSLNEKGAEVREYLDTCKNLEGSETESKKQRQEKNRLEKLFRGLGTLMQLRQKEAELKDLGDLPPLGAEFAKEWDQAREAKTRRETALLEAEESLRRLKTQIDSVPEPKLDPVIQGRISGLVTQIAEVKGAFRDLPEQLRLRDDASRQIQKWVQQWFPGRVGNDLADWVPGERILNQISQAANEWQIALTRDQEATRALQSANEHVRQLEQQANQLPPLEDLEKLKSLLDDLARLTFNEQTLAQAGGVLKRDRDAILGKAKRLVPPVDSEEALGRIATPTHAAIQDIVDRFHSREKNLERLRSEIVNLKNSLSGAEAELLQLQSGVVGNISRSDYEATKTIRDNAWELIRSERKGNPSDQARIQTLIHEAAAGIDLDETLTVLLGRADHQADGLLSHAEIVSKCEMLRQTITSYKQDIEYREHDLKEEVAGNEKWHNAFALQWAGWNAGPVVIESVRGLPEWMRKISELQENLAKNDSQVADHKAKSEELQGYRQRLSHLLNSEGSFEDLRSMAKAKIRDREEKVNKRTALFAQLEAQQNSSLQAERLRTDAGTRLAQAQEKWEEITRSLGQPVQESERVALSGHFQSLMQWEKERSTAATRVQQMETTLELFLANLAQVTTEVNTGKGPWDQASWSGAILGLQNLLEDDQGNSSRKKELHTQWETAKGILSKAQTERDQAFRLRDELLQRTGCENEQDVPLLLERLGRKAVLEHEISDMRGNLVRDMMMPLEEYIAELGDQKAAELDEKIRELEHSTNGLDENIKTLGLQKQRMETILGELVKSDEAAKARQEIEDAKVLLEEAVRDWKLQHLSLLCLNQAIENNRQNNADSPLARAAGFFQRMTLGSFDRVEFEDAGNELVLKVSRKGSNKFMELSATEGNGLSEGTADQLWLALRLAGIEAQVDKMIKDNQSPMPVILDDVLITFDDDRTNATLELLAELGQKTQVIVFTHHNHVCELAKKKLEGNVDVVDLVGEAIG